MESRYALHIGAASFEASTVALLSSHQGELISRPGTDALGLSSWGPQMITGTDRNELSMQIKILSDIANKALCFAMLSFSTGSRS